MKKSLLLSLVLIFIFTTSVLAQNKTISGTVLDSATQQPLAGASITATGTSVGTTANSEGKFTLQVPQDVATLTVSQVNHESKVVTIGTETNLVIYLAGETKGLEEVVVIGYGTQKKKDITGAVSTISAKDVGGRQTLQISEALQGSIAGVSVTRNNGAPGAGATIRIRGITTGPNADNNPLILVDGVPVSSIDNVNPNDVETLTVLKDAASAAIYGSRGAAGVVLITTKRGKNGQSSVEYTYEYGVQKPTSLPEFVGVQDYMRYFNERAVNDGGAAPYRDTYIDTYLDSNRVSPDRFPNTDWQNATLQRLTAPRQRHDLVFSIGTGKLKTKASVGYQKADAFYDNRNYERWLFRLNNDLQISEKLSANFDIAYKRTESQDIVTTVGFGNPIYEGRVLPPIYDDYYSDGRYAPGKDGRNPVAQIYDGGFYATNFNQIMGRLSVNFKPIKDLTITALISPTLDFDREKTFAKQINFTRLENPSSVLNTNFRNGNFVNETRSEDVMINGQFLINYDKNFADKHSVNVLAGYEENYGYFGNLGASRDRLLLDFPYLTGSEQLMRNSSGAQEFSLRSVFGRLSYNFNEKYYLQANLRYDQSSRFGKQYRSARFPSVSAGWVLTQEDFMKDISWLSFLKIRGSLGEVGNERLLRGNVPDYYPYQAVLNPSFPSPIFYQGNTAIPLSGYAQVVYAVDDVTWETTRTAGLGLDMAFLNNRLNVTADYFKKKTRDILLVSDIPNYVGFADPFDNLGSIEVKGWELEAGWRDHVGKLNYSVAANISDAKSKVIEITNTGALGSQVNLPGSEFNEWYGYKSAGLFQTAEDLAASPKFPASKVGDVKYVDIDGDGQITSLNDRVLLGGSQPRYQYGGNIRLDYSGFDFGLAFQGVGKRLSLVPFEQVQPFAEAFGNMPAALAGRFWSSKNSAEQNLAAQYPRLSALSQGNNYVVSNFWLMSGAYFRMKNITLGYTLRQPVLEKAGVKSVRFYVSGNDLFTVDKFPSYIDADPETANLTYPIVRTIIAGATIRF